jgi:hypothetical protein
MLPALPACVTAVALEYSRSDRLPSTGGSHANHGTVVEPLTAALARQREFRERGFLRESFALADPSPLPQLCRDVALFDAKREEWEAAGHAGIPYLFTDAIEHVARDAAIRAVVEAVLGTDAWVVWGPAIFRETPDAAARWHVDLDARYWPSVSVAVGLSGCSPDTVLSYLPGTHRLDGTPFSWSDGADTDRVLRRARRTNPECGPPEETTGFGDGRFYAFDGKIWHRGAPGTTTTRLILFLHYQNARAERVPLMLDYKRHRWSREPSPFLAAPEVSAVTTVAPLPVRERALDLVGRLWP